MAVRKKRRKKLSPKFRKTLTQLKLAKKLKKFGLSATNIKTIMAL